MAIGTAAAILGSAAIGAGASLYGSSQAGKAADKATQLQADQFNLVNEQQAPWREIGGASIGLLGQGFGMNLASGTDWAAYGAANPDLQQEWQRLQADGTATDMFGNDPNKYYQWQWEHTGKAEGRGAPPTQAGASGSGQVPNFLDTFSEDDFRADPGYQFRLNEGLKAVQGSAAARGGLLSGGTLKAMNRFAQGNADQSYNDAYNRFNNDRSLVFNRLASLAGMGQTANGQIAAAGQNYANAAGNNALYAAGQRGQAANNIAGIGQNLVTQFGGYQQPGLLNANAFATMGGFNNSGLGYGGAGQDISSLNGLF